jgi:hypothetical protein
MERAYVAGATEHRVGATAGVLQGLCDQLTSAEKRLRAEIGLEQSKLDLDCLQAARIVQQTDQMMASL